MIIHTEADHLEMMRNARRWPVWPLLPLRHRSREAKDGSGGRELGFMIEGNGFSGCARPRVYIGLITFRLMGRKLEDLPVEDYASLEDVARAGWEVD